MPPPRRSRSSRHKHTTTGSVYTYTHTYTGIDLAATLGGPTAILGFTGRHRRSTAPPRPSATSASLPASPWPVSAVARRAGTTQYQRRTGNPAIAGDVLTLTNAQHSGEASAAWFNTPVSTGSFTASFTYTDQGGGGADGAAFVLQNDLSGATVLAGAVGWIAGR